jgi:hypothetical protein
LGMNPLPKRFKTVSAAVNLVNQPISGPVDEIGPEE